MKGFKLFGGKTIDNLGDYCKDYLDDHDDIQIWVGTDSHERGGKITYVTVVCFYHESRGAHVIFKRYKVPSQSTMAIEKRLWIEVEDSRIVADYLETDLFHYRKDKDKNLTEIDLDLNSSKWYKSNNLHDSAVGYLTGLGYVVRTKPDLVAACCAADLLCK